MRKDEVRSAGGERGPQKRAIQGKPKTASKQPKGTVSKAKVRSQVKEPGPETPSVATRVADDKKPLAKKRNPKTALSGKPGSISPKPEPAESPKKPEAKSVITLKKETLPTSEKKTESMAVRPEPPVSEKKPEAGSVAPAKEGVFKTPIAREPESISVQSKGPVIAKKTLSHPYSLYLGSFRTLERAERAISQYSEKGLSPYCSTVDFNEKGTWFRVFTGHFQDREKAEKFKEGHRLNEGTVKKTPYANLIGSYTQSEELESRLLSLKRLGYFPYVIKGEDGASRLYVGAFITREGAEQQYHHLKLNGIQSQIVQR